MRPTSCPILVGRGSELDLVGSSLAAAVRGEGGVLVIIGEAGIGKTRLGDEARRMAIECGMRVAVGRAVTGETPAPFRPLSEAVLAAFRASGLPDDDQLDAFRAHLGRLVPQWANEVSPETSTLLVGEAIVRLLRAGAGETGDAGWLLVLEDLQWADADTLAVVEFLADTLATESVLCLVTVRTDGTSGSGHDVVGRLRGRRAQIVDLPPLDHADVAVMTAACLGLDSAPADLDVFIASQSEGAPLYVEELLAGLVASGRLVDGATGWTVEGVLQPRATSSIAESVGQRMTAVGSAGRAVLSAAAVIGRRFDWQLLTEAAAVDASTVTRALRDGVDQQLIEVDGDGFAFRHALVHQAVLDALLPPERMTIAARALRAIEQADPDLSGGWCELAAALAETAREFDRAATLLVECARRSIARGALSTADQTLDHALELTPESSRRAVELAAVDVWPQVGKASAAVELGTAALARADIDDWSPTDRLDVLNSVALAALATGQVAVAASAAESAMEIAMEVGESPGGDTSAMARAQALAARIAVVGGDTDAAKRLASDALQRAIAIGRADIECDCLDVLGRATYDFPQRIALFERSRDVAAGAGLTGRRLRAEFDAATVDAIVGDDERLRALRALAASLGAVDTAAAADLLIADLALLALDHDTCLAGAQRCVEASRRFGLGSLPVALVWLAGAHAIGGRGDEMEACLAEAVVVAPDDRRIAADAAGRVRSMWAFLSGDRDGFRAAIDGQVELARDAPSTSSIFAGRTLWTLLQASFSTDAGSAAITEAADLANIPLLRDIYGWSNAIAAGRHGDGATAVAIYERHAEALPAPTRSWGTVQIARLLVTEAALRDGWGQPVPWLRELEASFFERGLERAARDCRSLLGQAGEPVPRRRRGQSPVPPGLRALGITGREVEVLLLIAQRKTNREIADELFLSVRTVEHHTASLFTRTGVRDRASLAAFATLTNG